MMYSEPDHIHPEIFNPKKIRSVFTEANRNNPEFPGVVSGFNLGLNTPEGPLVLNRNRARLAEMLNSDETELAYAEQVHSTNIRYVTEGGVLPETDGMYTDKQDLILGIQVADCAVVLLADEDNEIIGAAHAGWRGALGGIVPDLISKMTDIGAVTHEMKAFVSPCISIESFEVGREVADRFPERFVDYHRFEKPHIDLKQYLMDQLMSSGLKVENIELNTDCTVLNNRYYSYRREGKRSGRMMGAIKLAGE
ncbi:peptidoglycan editing factor PgeF [Balneola sp. MJW-20]|uniref:peptidoglycan editing factor PgeF n=1 Tax=Gracilimonas aurantiaca TaxID=3234185 RepID=UPI003465973E